MTKSRRAATTLRESTAHPRTQGGSTSRLDLWPTGNVRVRAAWIPSPQDLSVNACHLFTRESLQTPAQSHALRAPTASTLTTGPSVWTEPLRTLTHQNLLTRVQARGASWPPSVCTGIHQDTLLLVTEGTLPHFMMDLFTGGPPDLIPQAGTKAQARSTMTTVGPTPTVPAGWRVADPSRGLKGTDQ